jgi:isftu1 transposase
MDESGFDLNMIKEYGWNQKGKRLHGERSGNRTGKRVTVISAYCNSTKKLIAPIYFKGNTDTESFNYWLEEHLLPTLPKGKTIIMDNASFHKSEKTKELIERAGCHLLFLPPYSPDYNPIEQKWAHVKNDVKKSRDNFPKFTDCLDSVFRVSSCS